mgnify:CR=1 FL=1
MPQTEPLTKFKKERIYYNETKRFFFKENRLDRILPKEYKYLFTTSPDCSFEDYQKLVKDNFKPTKISNTFKYLKMLFVNNRPVTDIKVF